MDVTFITAEVQRIRSEPLGVGRLMGTNERINGKYLLRGLLQGLPPTSMGLESRRVWGAGSRTNSRQEW